MNTKTRFCPSPTGLMHIGNARTALFNALLAQQKEGIFLLRIEDTDLQRSGAEYVQGLESDLLWLQLPWQEGPGQDLGNGPYFQSQRQQIYTRYYQALEEKGIAYPCFCSEEELALMRKMQRAAGKPPRYAGTCRNLSAEKIKQKLLQGLQPTLRFHVPTDCAVEFHDLVKGQQKFRGHDIGDFIIRRADSSASFMFCNAIDDALMGVRYAVRGEDHLTNTPRQILILKALDLPVPAYGHISLIVGSDGSPLSKRHGSRSIRELRQQGFFPEAINNYMARLGHHYERDVYMTQAELASQFKLEHLGRSPARFDHQHLLRWQQEVIARKSVDALWQWAHEAITLPIPLEKREAFIATIKSNVLFPQDVAHYALIFFGDLTYSSLPQQQKTIITQTGSAFFKTAIQAVQDCGQDFKAISQYLQNALHLRGKALFQPLRVALTGELHGPEMATIFKLLPVSEMINRLNVAQHQSTLTTGI